MMNIHFTKQNAKRIPRKNIHLGQHRGSKSRTFIKDDYTQTKIQKEQSQG